MSTDYNEFLTAMEEAYQAKSGLSPKVATDIHLRFQVLAGELAKLSQALQGARQNIFPQSSAGAELDLHGQLRGLARKPASKSIGQLTFSRHTPATQSLPVPKGTLVATASDPPLYFVTTVDSYLPTGQQTVSIPAESQQEGSECNILADKIKVLVTPPPGLGQVTNPTPFSGGRTQELDSDFRPRVVGCYRSPTNGSNKGYYQALLEAHPLVRLGKVIPRHKGRGTVQLIYVPLDASQTATIHNQLQETLLQQREIGVDVTLTLAETKTVSLTIQLMLHSGFEFPHIEPLVRQVVTDYFYALPIGESFLRNQLGKLLLDIQGVRNYNFTAPTGDVIPLPHQKLTCNSLVIKREGE